MKATKKLLLFAFVVTLMITMLAAFAITASAEDSTLGFTTGSVNSEITYGDPYTTGEESIVATAGSLPTYFKNATYALLGSDGNVYTEGVSNVGTYFYALMSYDYADGQTATFTYTYNSDTNSLVGTATVANGDIVTFNTAKVKVVPKDITVTVDSIDSKIYDGTTTIFADQINVTFAGLVTADEALVKIAVSNGVYASKDVATGIALNDLVLALDNVDATNPKSQNYNLTNPEQTGFFADIEKRTLTVSLVDNTKVYGEADSLAPSFTGMVAGETPLFSGTIVRDPGENVGEYNVDFSGLVLEDNGSFLAANYTFVAADGVKYVITKAALTITVNDTKTYDANAFVFDLTGATVAGLKGTDAITGGTITTVSANVGTYTVEATDWTAANLVIVDATITNNYEVSYVVSLEITKAALTITVNDTKTYDANAFVFDLTGATVTGLKGTDAITGGTITTTSANVKTYTVETTDWTAANLVIVDATITNNYEVSYVVSLEITKAALTITVNDTKSYDATAFVYTITDANATGLKGSDTIVSGTITTTSANVGTYTVVTTDWTAANLVIVDATITNNYEVSYVVSLEITKATLTITVNDVKTYDATAFVYTITDANATGLMGSDTIVSGTITTTSANAGIYTNETTDWTVANLVITDATITANYDVKYVVSLTIEKAELKVDTVTIANPYYYNGTTTLDPADVSVTLKGAQGADVLDYAISNTAWTAADAGTDTVTFDVTLNGVTAVNYYFTAEAPYAPTGANNEINKCQIEITKVNTVDYDRFYDATTNFDLAKLGTVEYVAIAGKGAVAADAPVVVITALNWVNKNAGTTKVNVTAADVRAEDTNYELVLDAAAEIETDNAIRAAKLYIVPDAAQFKVYAANDTTIAYKYYVEGKNLADNANWNYDLVDDIFDGSLARNPGEDAGLYLYEQGSLILKDNGAFEVANYELTLPEEYFDGAKALDENKFEIVKRTVVVTPNNGYIKVYWDKDPVIDYTFKVNTSFDTAESKLIPALADNTLYVYDGAVWTTVTDKALIFAGALVRDGYNADRAQSIETIGTYNAINDDLALIAAIAKNYTLVVDETTAANNTYDVVKDSQIAGRDATETITVANAGDEVTIVKAEIRFVAENLTITYGDIYGTDYKYYFYIDVVNSTEKAILGSYKGQKLTTADIDNLVNRTIVLDDGIYTFTFADGFTCVYPNTEENVNAGVYADMIKFYDESDVTLKDTATDDVVWNGTPFEYGTLKVEKKEIKLAFENIKVVYGTVAPTFTIVPAEGYSFVGTDTFANSFRVETDAFRYETMYSSTSPVLPAGESYAINNNCDIKKAFYSNNYEILYYNTVDSSDYINQIAPGSITVTPKELVLVPYVGTFDPDNVSSLIEKEFGAAHPVIEYAVVGLIGDQVAKYAANITIVGINGDEADGVGTYSFAISDVVLTNNDSTGFYAQNYTLTISNEVKFHIYAATIELSGTIFGSDKIYDGTTDYAGTFDFAGMTATANGVAVNGLTYTVVAHFADKNAEQGKTLIITSVECSDANYKVDFTALVAKADIEKKDITAANISANDKVYNANDVATVFVPEIGAIFADMIPGDDLKVTATGVFENKNVGTDKKVTITLVLSGTDEKNYNLTNKTIEDTATITKATLIITGITAKDKVYDGTTKIEFVYDEKAVVGVLENNGVYDQIYIESVTGAFADANVGNKKNVAITVTLGGADVDNYKYTDVEGTQTSVVASITPATITITINDAEIDYGMDEPAYSYTNGTLYGANDVIEIDITGAYDVSAPATRKAGAYKITATAKVKTTYGIGETTYDNYNVVIVDGTLTVNKILLNVTVVDKTVTYGDDIPTYTFTAETLMWNDTIADLGTPVFTCDYIKGAAVEDYVVSISHLSSENYDFVYKSGLLTVKKAVLTITPVDTTITYGEAPACSGYTVTGWIDKDMGKVVAEILLSGKIEYAYTQDSYDAGVYTNAISIKDVTSLLAKNYTFETGYATLTVEKANLTVVPGDMTIIYGEDVKANTYTFEGLVNGDVQADIVITGGTVGYDYDGYVIGSDVGTYTITAVVDGLETANYNLVAGTATLTVNKAQLKVTADDKAITYGDLAPEQKFYSFTATGFVAGDDEAVLLGTAVYTCEYKQNNGVGDYAIAISGLDAKNYEIEFVDGTLTVNKKALTVKPVDTTITYGDEPTCDGYTLVGLTPYDAALTLDDLLTAGVLEYNHEYVQYANVGTYKIEAVVTTLVADNYDFYAGEGTLTVNKKALTVTADDKDVTYGEAAPEYTFTAEGYVGTDSDAVLTGKADYDCDYAKNDDAGTYVIAISGLDATNYEITFVDGTLTVNKKALDVIAVDKEITYGDLAPVYTYTVDGLIENDLNKAHSEIFTGNAVYDCTYQQNSNAGDYVIAVSGLSAKNYEITFVDGTLTVNKKALAVKPVDTTITFGDAPTCNGNTLVGLTPYDSALTLETLPGITGELTFAYDYAQYGNVGTYTITSVVDDLECTNYYFVEAEGTLTVEAYVINAQITANGEITLDVIYGDVTPEYLFSNDDATKAVIAGASKANTLDLEVIFYGYEEGDYVGTYTVTCELADTTKNFVLGEILPATVNVAKKALTITANDINVEYGDDPKYTVTFDGLANCDLNADGTLNLDRGHITLNEVFTNNYKTTDPAGTTHRIIMAAYVFESENYEVTKVNGELTVVKRVIDVKVNEIEVTYGNVLDLAGLTYVIEEGFLYGDTFASAFGIEVANLYTKATTSYVPGTAVADMANVTIEFNGLVADNYTLNFTYEGVKINKRDIDLTIDDFTVIYGNTPDQTGKFTLGESYNGETVNVTLVYVDYVAGVSNAGTTYVINATTDNGNYNIVYTPATLTVVKKAVTLTVGNATIVYGESVDFDAVTVTPEGFFGTQGVTFDKVATNYAAGSNKGTYVLTLANIKAIAGTDLDNYTITVVDGALTVTARKVTVTANANTIIYGDAALNAGVTFDNVYGTDTVIDAANIVYTFNVKADGTGDAYAIGSAVGTYYIIPAADAANINSNYEVTFVAGELTVNQKKITVTANDGEIVYNNDAPVDGFGFTVTPADGLVGDDKLTVVYSYNYVKGDNAGEYVITINGEDANYDITFVEGKLTVKKQAIQIKVDLDNTEFAYGTEIKSLTGFSTIIDTAFADMVEQGSNGYILEDYVTTDPAKRGIGTYKVTVTGFTVKDATNYELVFVGETTVEIVPLAITITPDAKNTVYGDAAPENTWSGSYHLIPYAEDLNEFIANIVLSNDYVAGTTVSGEYAIKAAFVDGYTNENYVVTFKDGTLTVAKRAITFTVSDAEISYGDVEPNYVVNWTGFLGEDTFENSFKGQIIIDAKGYNVGSNIGSYKVSVDAAYIDSDKYVATYEGTTTLTVIARAVTVTADNFTITYGDALPEFTYTLGDKGLAPNHTDADLGTFKFTCTYGAGNPVGDDYKINITFTANATYAANYNVTVVAGTLKVEAKELVITPVDTTILKGTKPEPVIEFTYSGLVNGDVVEFVGALGRANPEVDEIGAYNITLGTLKVLSPNYILVLDAESTAKFNIVGLTISNVSLTLGFRDEIFMNYYFKINNVGDVKLAANGAYGILQWTEAQYNALGGNYAVEGNEAYILGAVFDENGKGYNLKANGQAIAAPLYNDTYYTRAFVKLADGTYVYGNIIEYSVVDYAKVMIEGEYDNNIKALMISLLDYGTATQRYFYPDAEIATYDFITPEIRTACGLKTFEQLTMPEIDTSLKTVEGVTYNADLNWTVGSATFDGAFKLNFYGVAVDAKYTAENFGVVYWTAEKFAEAGNKFDLAYAETVMLGETVEGLDITLKTSDIGYVLSVDELAAAEGTDRYYVAMFTIDAEGNRSYGRVTYLSVEDYAYLATQNAENETIANVGKAVLVYLDAARAYKAANPDWQ